MKHLLLSLMLTSISGLTFAAGGVVGNGGDVVYCPGKAPELLDIYEAGHLYQMNLQPTSGSTPEEMAKFALKRMEKLDPLRMTSLSQRVDRFMKDANIIPNVSLFEIPDVYPIAIPKDCKIKQIAIQKARVLPQDPLYLIDQELWNSIDTYNKAALILHEVIYTDAIHAGHTNSVNVRYFNGLIHSDRLAQMTLVEYYYYVAGKASLPFYTATDAGIALMSAGKWIENGQEADDITSFEKYCQVIGMVPANPTDLKTNFKKIVLAVEAVTNNPTNSRDGLVVAGIHDGRIQSVWMNRNKSMIDSNEPVAIACKVKGTGTSDSKDSTIGKKYHGHSGYCSAEEESYGGCFTYTKVMGGMCVCM